MATRLNEREADGIGSPGWAGVAQAPADGAAVSTCPAGIDPRTCEALVPGGQRSAEAGLGGGHPLPSIRGRICPRPCQVGAAPGRYPAVPSPLTPSRPRRVAVLGSGPTGLAAAFHLRRAGCGVTVFDPAPGAGGTLRSLVPPFRLPRAVLRQELERFTADGVEIRTGWTAARGAARELEGYDRVVLAEREYRPRTLGIPGESDGGVFEAVEFLEAVHRGERPDPGWRVVVLGGGVVALDCARTLKRLGSDPIVVYRRTRRWMPAPARDVEETMREGIEILYLSEPEAFLHVGGRLSRVHFARMAIGESGADGRRAVAPIRDGGYAIEADGVIRAIGEAGPGEPGPEAARSPVDRLPERWGAVSLADLVGDPGRLVTASAEPAGPDRSLPSALGLGRRLAQEALTSAAAPPSHTSGEAAAGRLLRRGG